MTVNIEEKCIREIDILAGNTVRKKNVLDYITEVGSKFFENNLEEWICKWDGDF